MASLANLQKTAFKHVFYRDEPEKGKVYVAQFKVDGKRYTKTLGYSKDEYRTNDELAYQKKEEFRKQVLGGVYDKSRSKLIEPLVQEYLEHCRIQSPQEVKSKRSNLKNHFADHFPNKRPEEISTNELQSIANKLLLGEGGVSRTLKPKTVKNIILHISGFFDYCINNTPSGCAPIQNPVKKVKIPKFDNRKKFPLSLPQCQALYSTIINWPEPVWRGVFVFLLHGHRKNEVLSLEQQDVDIEAMRYSIDFEIDKARKNRQRILTPIQKECLVDLGFQGAGLLFLSPKTSGKIQDPSKAWRRIKNKAGIDEPLRIHDIRHLLGHIGINYAKLNYVDIGAILGHSSGLITERYGSAHEEKIDRDLQAIFSVLSS